MLAFNTDREGIMKTSTTNTLLIVAAIVVIGGIGIKNFVGEKLNYDYVPGTTREYHPPVGADREDAAEALRATGFQAASGESVADIFVPKLEAGESVAFDIRLSHQQIESDEPTNVHAAVSILAADKLIERKRPPLNVAVVIDRSGSMLADDKMEYARAASHTLIDSLGAQDRIAIISYSTDVTTHVTGANPVEQRAQLHQIINDLECYGGTNISAGLEEAHEALKAHRGDGLSRVVLLSDGRANNGLVTADELGRLASNTLESGISVSSLGMGLDYDEVVMQAIARAGAGNYHFIDDVAQTEEVFAGELGDLTQAVARGAMLRIKLGPQVLIEDVHGFPYTRTADGFTVPLDSFSRAERKDLLLSFDVESDDSEVKLFDAELHYTDVETKQPRTLRRQMQVATGWSAKPFVPVMKRVQQIRTIDAFQKAMELYDEGRRHEAAELLEAQREQNREFLDDADIEDRAFERVDGKLTQLAEALRKTEVTSTRGKWLKKATFQYANEAVHSEVNF